MVRTRRPIDSRESSKGKGNKYEGDCRPAPFPAKNPKMNFGATDFVHGCNGPPSFP